MGLRQWRKRRSMGDPVQGEFRRTGSYFPKSTVHGVLEMMTGVVTGPGVTPTPGEAMEQADGKFVGRDTFPALVDRADPANFEILWDEIEKVDDRAAARAQAADAARHMQSGITTEADVPVASAPTPAWATEMVADLAARGLIPGLDAGSAPVIRVDAPQVTVETGGPVAGARPGSAVLRDVADIPLPPGSLPFPGGSLCTLTLEVQAPTGAYTVQCTQGFKSAQTRAAVAVRGSVLPVLIDPNDPHHVSLDVAEFFRGHPGLAH